MDDCAGGAVGAVETRVNYFEDYWSFANLPGMMRTAFMGINLGLQVLGVSRVGRVATCAGERIVRAHGGMHRPWLGAGVGCAGDRGLRARWSLPAPKWSLSSVPGD